MKGFLLVDKKRGSSSFSVIRELRSMISIRKIGHAGTLDPLATGLLILAIGEGTKLLKYFIGLDKEYEVEANFGLISDTYDADGEVESSGFKGEIMKGDVEKMLRDKFLGEIMQVPPQYSALKVGGFRAYDLARKGEDPQIAARPVVIDSFEMIDFSWPVAKFRVNCSSGTYIRSLIHDLGRELACGAIVGDLRRTRVGSFFVQDAVDLSLLDNKIEQSLLPLEKVVESFDSVDLNVQDLLKMKDGKVLMDKKIDQDEVMGFHDGRLLGIVSRARGGIKLSKIIH